MTKRRSETCFIYLILEEEKAQEDHDDDFGMADFDDPTPCHSDDEGDNEGPIGDIDPLENGGGVDLMAEEQKPLRFADMSESLLTFT